MNTLEVNSLALAYLGDSVYESYIREYLIKKKIAHVKDLQEKSLDFVSAKSQARILRELIHIFCGLRKSYIFTQNISEITLYLISILSSILILYYKNIAIFIILAYLWIIVFKNKKEIIFKEKIYESIDKFKKN